MKRRVGDRPRRQTSQAPRDQPIPNVRKERIGVWDFIIEQKSVITRLPAWRAFDLPRHLPYLRRFIKDLLKVSPGLFAFWLIATACNSFIPAVSLYWSSRLLQLVQTAVESRKLDQDVFIRVALLRMLCSIASRLLSHITNNDCSRTLNRNIGQFFDEHLLRAHVRLDLVTFTDPKVQEELSTVSPQFSAAWRALSESVRVISTVAQLVGQISVLAGVIHQQRNGMLFFWLTMLGPLVRWASRGRTWRQSGSWFGNVWNDDYLRMMGLRSIAFEGEYREDIVSGNLQSHIQQKYHELSVRLGNAAMSFREAWNIRSESTGYGQLALSTLSDTSRDLPQILFAFSAVHKPSDIPVSLSWLSLLRETVTSIGNNLDMIISTTGSLDDHFESIRSLYDCACIENQIVDGTESYTDSVEPSTGLSIEFQNVSFKYPGSEKWALDNVSFKIESGQLCVLVGCNGSGKSSAVRLLSRLYDHQTGQILIDGRPIHTLLLSDYRRRLSVLPQKFTYFPMTVAENIGIGDPANSDDMDRIRKSADLGGALEFIERDLPDGFNARLKGPQSFRLHSRDQHFGAYAEKEARNHRIPDMSGGQWQRLALSRTFMRSSDATRLLCYDEPSAALDPLAEYDLFQRLRQLRGHKTMLFVTHRFGHLTRYADKIIYLDESRVVEQGTHAELLARGGGYAKLYNLQAQAFSPT